MRKEGVMSQPWASFLEARAGLRRRIASACRAAADAATLDEESLRGELVELHGLLAHDLLHHMAVEERVLYPALARAEGQMIVELLSADHRAIAGLEREIATVEETLSSGGLAPDERLGLVRALYGLEMLVDLHMAKEEDICLPALDRELSSATRQDLEASIATYEMAEQQAE
jgi:iron-sulfur cluster repair protein YtfE (RIC family)